MIKHPPNIQSYIALGNLALAHLRQSNTRDLAWVKQLEVAEEGVERLSPNHPRVKYLQDQIAMYK
jgi:hypothetical protein